MADGRAEVHLHAVLETGEAALVVANRFRPYFFVRAAERDTLHRVAALTAAWWSEAALLTFAGEPVLRVGGRSPGDVPPPGRGSARPASSARGRRPTAYATRIDHGIRGAFLVDGPFARRPGVGRVYRNPRLEPAVFEPRLRILSLDIETSLDGRFLYSIAVAGHGGDHVWVVRSGESGPLGGLPETATALRVPSERACLQAFLGHLRATDPDVLTGWNIGDFDVTVLQRVARRAQIRLALGRTEEEAEVRRDLGFTRDPRVILSGRQVPDGLALSCAAPS